MLPWLYLGATEGIGTAPHEVWKRFEGAVEECFAAKIITNEIDLLENLRLRLYRMAQSKTRFSDADLLATSDAFDRLALRVMKSAMSKKTIPRR
jgi:hypothetical protein